MSSARRPFLSVIVAHESAHSDALPRTLRALGAQTIARDAYEVLLVHGPGSDPALASVRPFEGQPSVRSSRAPAEGPAAAWRHAASEAAGEILLFLDVARVAAAGLLAAHEGAHRGAPMHVAVMGATGVEPALGSDPLPQLADEACHGAPPGRSGEPLDLAFFRVDGSSFARTFLLEAGEWDRPFPAGCEEAELGWRLARRGLELRYDPAAVSAVATPVTFVELCVAAHRKGRSELAFAEAHPEEEQARRLAHVAAARDLWRRVAPVHDALLRSASELDRLSRLRRGAGLPARDLETTLLRRGYWTAFRSCRARAIADPGCAPPTVS